MIEQFTQALLKAMPQAIIQFIDEADKHIGHANSGQGHYALHIASPELNGLSKIAQHRLIYNILQPWMNAGIHALSIQVNHFNSTTL